MHAFQRTTTGPGVRSGIRLPQGKWVLLDEPTDALLNDPGIIHMEVSGKDDPRLANLETYDPGEDPIPDPEDEGPSEDAVLAYAEEHGLAILPQKQVDSLTGERDRLKKQVEKLEKDIENIEGDRKVADEKHKNEITRLKGELSEVKKGK